jgi:adenosine deaminase
MITEAFVKTLPKTDLHVHLDGSIRMSTLIDLAREYPRQAAQLHRVRAA